MLDVTGWTGLYKLLAAVGAPKPQVPAKVGKGQVSIGWPDIKVGLVFPNDQPDPKAGWTLIKIPTNALGAISSLTAVLDRTSLEIEVSYSEQEATKKTSKTEQLLLKHMLKAGLPMPRRDLVFEAEDKSIKTYPDFCWPDTRLAVELDGHWWHGGKDLSENVIQRIRESDDETESISNLQDRARTAAAHDAAKRRILAEQGWTLMVVSSVELAGDDIHNVAAQIKKTWENLQMEEAPMEPHLQLVADNVA